MPNAWINAPDRAAIIGTAGRKDDAERLNVEMYDVMYKQTVGALANWKVRTAVSGLAAYADHLAVRAYLKGAVEDLLLFAPAHWNGRRFESNQRVQFNLGRTMNGYHEVFSRKVGIDSFAEIGEAVVKGAKVVVHEGFHTRNTDVAENATHLLAFTFGKGMEPPCDVFPASSGYANPAGLKNGGTSDTWRKASRCAIKRHVSLSWIEANLAGDPTAGPTQMRLF